MSVRAYGVEVVSVVDDLVVPHPGGDSRCASRGLASRCEAGLPISTAFESELTRPVSGSTGGWMKG